MLAAMPDAPAADDPALLAGLRALDRAADLPDALVALKATAVALGLPVLAWSPDVARPAFEPRADVFMRREGWPDEVMSLWWDKTAMLRSPIYVRCRTEALPFVTGSLTRTPARRPELKLVASAMQSMGVTTLVTVPVHLPRGRVAMVTFGGAIGVAGANGLLARHRPELVAAGHLFMRAVDEAAGRLHSSAEERVNLTPREWECLRAFAQGCRQDEVATLIGLAPTTVRFHLDNVIRKLGATNRVHAVALAAQLGLLGSIG